MATCTYYVYKGAMVEGYYVWWTGEDEDYQANGHDDNGDPIRYYIT